VAALAIAAEHRDDDTGEHIRRIGDYSALIARRLGWGAIDIERLRLAAMLHDVGKIGIPDAILSKPEPLSPEEEQIMQGHTVIGHQITSQSNNRIMNLASVIALSHHELWDGSGFPNGLAGEEIAIEARIVTLADQYDGLRWKRKMSHEQAIAAMFNGNDWVRPEFFDPQLLAIFKQETEAFARIFDGEAGPGQRRIRSGHGLHGVITLAGGATFH